MPYRRRHPAQESEAPGAASDSPPKEEPSARWEAQLLSLITPRRLYALPAAWKYVLAVMIAVTATALRWALIPVLGTAAPYNTALVATVVATILLGMGPGLASAISGNVAIEVLLLQSPSLLAGPVLMRLALSTAIGAFVAWLLHALRASATRARRAEELRRVKDLLEEVIRERTEALRESEERYRGIVEMAKEGIATHEPDGTITYVNQRLADMLGYSPEEIIGRSSFDFVDDEEKKKVLQARESLKTEGGFSSEAKLRRKDGSILWTLANVAPRRDGSGNFLGYLAMHSDITERKRAEEALRESRLKYQNLIETTSDFIWEVDSQGKYTYCSPQMEKLWGLKPEEMVGKTPFDQMPPGAREEGLEFFLGKAKSKSPFSGIQVPSLDGRGHLIMIEISAVPFFDAQGELQGYRGVTRDVTERERTQKELLARETLLSALTDNSPDAIYVKDTQSRWLMANPAVLRIVGKSSKEALGKTDLELYADPEIGMAILKNDRQILKGKKAETFEEFADTPDGRRLFLSTKAPWFDAKGSVIGLIGISHDITEHKKAEEALRESEGRFRMLSETSPIGVGVSSADGRLLYTNPAYETMLGYDRGKLLGKKASDLYLNPDDRTSWLRAMKEGGAVRNREIRLKRKDGIPIWVSINTSDIFYGGQQALMGTIQDITERRQAEKLRRALAEQEKLRLGAAVEQASDAVVMVNLDGTIRYVNAAFEAINRITRGAAAGTSYFDLLGGEPDVEAAVREAVAAGRPWHGPLTRIVPDARPVELEVTTSPAKDPSGAVIGGLITEKDVTRENALQNQVRQAQKMEALGTLAGGITHDFNNILGTIILNTELALLDLDPANPARQTLPLVLRAANRGKELVKQIITFSRQRTWERKPLEIVPIVREGLKLLRTTLPKDIAIQEALDAESGVVMADPSHVHQVLVNLCQNAALAMKDNGGRLEVKLARAEVDEAMTARHPNLKPGLYALLAVSDTGCGMTKEVRERIFEPFFTTRRPGEGSGLGLAVVHGIVRTYDGEITVTSEPGKGSRFNVYFPRLEGEKPAAEADDRAEPQNGGERILLVEDEKAQRESLERGLGHLGYRVTARADGRSAWTAFKKDPAAFDLIITDQVMPRMTGLELAAAAAALRPDIPVILCTGFSEKVNAGIVGKSGVRDFIMKPYTIRDLTVLIRKAVSPK